MGFSAKSPKMVQDEVQVKHFYVAAIICPAHRLNGPQLASRIEMDQMESSFSRILL